MSYSPYTVFLTSVFIYTTIWVSHALGYTVMMQNSLNISKLYTIIYIAGSFWVSLLVYGTFQIVSDQLPPKLRNTAWFYCQGILVQHALVLLVLFPSLLWDWRIHYAVVVYVMLSPISALLFGAFVLDLIAFEKRKKRPPK